MYARVHDDVIVKHDVISCCMSYKSRFCVLGKGALVKGQRSFLSSAGEGELQDEARGPLQCEGGGCHHLGVCHQEERHCIW